MKLQNLKIGTQLRLGLGLILLFVLTLGMASIRQSHFLWLQSKLLYDHPLTVSRAVNGFEIDIAMMHLGMKELLIHENDQDIAKIQQRIAVNEADAIQRLNVLQERYLGPPADIELLRADFAQWNVLRRETIQMLSNGKRTAAIVRSRTGGVDDSKADELLAHSRKIKDFARDKADQFYSQATEQYEGMNLQFWFFLGAILLFTLLVAYYLLKGIREPLKLVHNATKQFRQGKRDARSGYSSANEFGDLSASFDAMADTIETEKQLSERAVALAGVMLQENEADDFCREVLKALMAQTKSQVGSVYLLNSEKTDFEHFESIGLADGARKSFSAQNYEGEFGTALVTGQIQRITNIPEETCFYFSVTGGDFKPREIITIPILSSHQTKAMISLASVHCYDEVTMQLLTNILGTLTARMNGVLIFLEVKNLASRLELQNRELEEQKKEMTAQASQLNQMNTELEMQKQQLAEASQLKSVFLSNMSHELRTPLNSVIALSNVLNNRLEGKIAAEEYSYLDVIERNGKHLLALINDILDLSRIEAGREDLSLDRFSLRALVGEIVTMLDPLAKEKNISLESQVSDNILIQSDPGKVRHILQNLAGNAVKFTESGSVTISVRLQGGDLYIDVEDTGIGIPADQLPHIFDEFRQADGSNSRKYPGTGLGLSIAKKYAGLLQGEIAVQSEFGRGSTFTLRLPFSHPLEEGKVLAISEYAPVTTVTRRPSSLDGRRQSILLVEDSAPIVLQMKDILSEQNYEVRVASSGPEALAKIEQSLPDAVILDLMMPEMDGFTILKAIRGMEKAAQVPVLILTAKHVTREELSVLKGNRITQLIRKGDISRVDLLRTVAGMVSEVPITSPEVLPVIARKPISGNPLVLVVEDNPDNLLTMKALLQDTCRIIDAGDGKEGVAQVKRHRPDLILMDIALPVMDGFAALTAIRNDPELVHIPIIAVTASSMKGDCEDVLAHGFDGYISKPIDAELLQQTIREVLNGNS